MPAFSRGLRPFLRSDYICSKCLQFSTTSAISSGHNRWSKIKHDKGAVDAKKTKARSIIAHDIALAVKLHGADPYINPRLATVLAAAKKAGFPKASMEAAIARGQGKSTTGAALQKATLECIMPPQVAMIIEAETDSVNRTMMDLRHLVKTHGGTVTPTAYLFQKKGCVTFEKDEKNLGVDDVMDEAIEAGAEDLEVDDEGNIVVWTEPNMVTVAGDALQKKFDIKIGSSDILWDPNEDTNVPVDAGEATDRLISFIESTRDNSDVQGIYANVVQGNIDDGKWEELISGLD
ncbi:uncharacterized protein EAE97_008227 [Botrytis byssoidea]|uniref:DUF28 domain-containing protein n=1 Tax=Botrytis byssoidea TaxID=139641 RepID=A0A9P5ICB8_9HELO|nr:uncharacterized protein EAE97_008227 [Botrytis byssoidea]KAF7935320.1 hypothetical protein EAE97_008227 [Botrytis byssoidea]